MDGHTGMTTAELAALVDRVAVMAPPVDEADRIERVRHFEALKSALTAAQMDTALGVVDARKVSDAAAGVPVERQGAGAAAEVGLARRVSPAQARRWLGLARVLTTELPATYAELRAGRTSEWWALIVARETIFLSRDDREQVDRELAPQLESLSDRAVEREARRVAYRLDPVGFTDRARTAAKDRRVGLRPAADTMCWLTALLPVEQAVATYASLKRHADMVIGIGEQGVNGDGSLHGHGQVMADTLVQRITGQTRADQVPVEINLVMTDRALLNTDATEPAILPGYGPLPAPLARDLALGAGSDTGTRWLRRLYQTPDTNELAAMDSTRREFTTNQRRFLRLRDHDTCRTPWCAAPIRHLDHVEDWARTKQTRVTDSRGTCQTCNYTKQAPGWHTHTNPDGDPVITTPTGHTYTSHAPAPPGTTPPPIPKITIRAPARAPSPLEDQLRELIVAAVGPRTREP